MLCSQAHQIAEHLAHVCLCAHQFTQREHIGQPQRASSTILAYSVIYLVSSLRTVPYQHGRPSFLDVLCVLILLVLVSARCIAIRTFRMQRAGKTCII